MNRIKELIWPIVGLIGAMTTMNCSDAPNPDSTSGGNLPMSCMTAADCPAPRNPCLVATCNMNFCDSEPVPDGTDSALQTPNDCKRVVCDAEGQTSQMPDDTDTRDDGVDCTVDSCTMGVPTSTPAAAGTTCDDDGGAVCNGNGMCIFITCGDGMANGPETCDDGNLIDDDGCDANCTITACGNGVRTSGEVCDDGNTTDSDGCSSTCSVEPNYQCVTEPPPGLCILAETLCTNGADDDADGMMDDADSDCALTASIPPCGPGETLYVFNSLDVPKVVPSESSNDSRISVTTGGIVRRAIVQLSIVHSYVTDVDVSVISPTGANVDLSTDNGEGGGAYTATVFDDGCMTSITDGSAPFTGCFFPEMPLSMLNDQSPDGEWILHVADDAPVDDGVLFDWSLALCVGP